jgi:hypothetical protein
MVPPGQGVSPVRKNLAHERSYTIMVMGGTGKVRSFRISRRLLFWAVFFFAAYIPFSVYLVNRFLELRHANFAQRERIERLERDLLRSEHAVSKSREYIVFLEDYVLQTEKSTEGAAEPAKTPEKRAAAVAPKPSDEQAREQDQKVSIQDLVIDKQGGKLAVNFKLVNLLPGDTAIGGYVYMMAKSKDSPPRQEWTYPQVKLVDGLPETFRRGKVFLVQRFKPMQGKLTVGSGQDAPAILEILVYDQAGNMMLQKDFEIPPTP